MKQQAQEGLQAAQKGLEQAIDKIPPDAWPMIDILFKITIGLLIVWILLALVAWWRRKAYNLTVASTAKKSKKAQPDFLKVDKKAREKAVERGEAHEEMLEEREREEALAALKAAKEPVTMASRLASFATFAMSLFTLLTALAGTVLNVGRMGDYVGELTSAGKVEYLIKEHTFGTLVVVFVIGFHVWKYVKKEKWKEA